MQKHADLQVRFILLHDHRNDDGIRQFFLEVWKLWVKVGPSVLLLVILCSLSLSLAIGLLLPLLWLNHVSRAACGVCARFVCENDSGRVVGYLVQCASQVVKHTLPETKRRTTRAARKPVKVM